MEPLRPPQVSSGSPEAMEIRPLRREDIPAIVEIETEAFSTPWRAETFRGLIGRDSVEVLVMTDEAEGVVAYAVLWCIMDQGELANLAVTSRRRGGGLGKRLLRHVMRTARDRGVRKLYLEVRSSNSRAMDLYRAEGFSDVGVRRGYYERPKEDAVIMMATLDTGPPAHGGAPGGM